MSVPDEAYRGPEAQLFEGTHFQLKPMSHGVPTILVFITRITHPATSNEKGRYAVGK